MANLDLYNRFRAVPKEAQKTIQGGNLNGKTDINPMWRIKMLTDTFGPVGFGWQTKITEHWDDTQTIGGSTERVAWVRLELYVKWEGIWSAPIEGIGGSKYAGKGRGAELNDEAFKMAETDAISVACKKLGIGADIYWAKDNTKYTQGGEQAQQQQQGQQTGGKFRPVTMMPNDINIRNQLVAWAAQGFDRKACESACNQYYKASITDVVWTKVMEAI